MTPLQFWMSLSQREKLEVAAAILGGSAAMWLTVFAMLILF